MIKKQIYLFAVFIFGMSFFAKAQLSEGGEPIDMVAVKSAALTSRILKMPSFKIPDNAGVSSCNTGVKSLTFGHIFQVDAHLHNSGQWFQTSDYRIWQLQIESEGAKSLGLIFSDYYLPEGARLFVFDIEKKTILGAFTCRNNKKHRRMSTFPIAGDKLILQYEEPLNAAQSGELKLAEVIHDYVGIVSSQNRWPRRLSGTCNVDVNCENISGTRDQQKSVCRILVRNELGTGTLLNNTSNNGRPFIISAFHVFKSKIENADVALFDFNYESPFCTQIDGYDQQSISGSVARAYSDSLDFMLVELSQKPPSNYRPYYSGWDRRVLAPTKAYTIHHPNGDTKKITYDEGECDSTTFSNTYLPNAHWKVFDWEVGTTEAGSSGAALFNSLNSVSGILTGGYASCDNLAFDAFSRFDKMWNYFSDSTHQLKCWLDSENTQVHILDGLNPYTADGESCTLLSNFLLSDNLNIVPDFAGEYNIREVGEMYTNSETIFLSGFAVGIKEFFARSINQQFSVTIYEADNLIEPGIKKFWFSLNSITPNGMNYFDFIDNVEITGDFMVSIKVEDSADSLVLFQSGNRHLAGSSTMMVNHYGSWIEASELNPDKGGASLLMQMNACGVSVSNTIDSLKEKNHLMTYYPNPIRNYLVVEFMQVLNVNVLEISDMAGRILFRSKYAGVNFAEIDVGHFMPGIYVLKLENGSKTEEVKLLKIIY